MTMIDGLAPHLPDRPENCKFVPSDEKPQNQADIKPCPKRLRILTDRICRKCQGTDKETDSDQTAQSVQKVSRFPLFQSTTFRLALIYLSIFSFSVLFLLGGLFAMTYWFVSGQTETAIDNEIAGLEQHYQARGLTGLMVEITWRSGRDRPVPALYLLMDDKNRILTGNLSSWPDDATHLEPGGWLRFEITRNQSQQSTKSEEVLSVLARVVKSPEGYSLLVGRSLEEQRAFLKIFGKALTYTLIGMVLLGLVGAFFVSRRLLGRVQDMTRSSAQIMRAVDQGGDMSARMPVNGSGDEFDQLSRTLNAMLDRIQDLMQAMQTMTANVAHDLRSPLTRIKSQLEVALLQTGTLAEEGDEPPSQSCCIAENHDFEEQRHVLRQVIHKTIREADSLLSIFSAILDITRAETGAVKEGFEHIDLCHIAEEIADLYSPVAEEKGMSLILDVDCSIKLWGHGPLLAQTMANLVDNAIKYAAPENLEGPAVPLILRVQGEQYPVIEVRDFGPGVPDDDKEKVLQRFVRLDKCRKQNDPNATSGGQSGIQTGNGLGLSLVAATARLHGATIALLDTRQGRPFPGLTVRLTFPDQQEN